MRDSSRDFITRLTSFSFALGDDAQRWRAKRNELLKIAFMLKRSHLDLRNKDDFKKSYAMAINTLLPQFDLVVVDEAHNLKHGRHSQAHRNKLLHLILGLGDVEKTNGLSGYGKRFERVLLLSATPLESDYAELWRQLDLFGFGDRIRELLDPEVDDERKKHVASRFLVRRLTGLNISGEIHTKNMYRREWRGGGCRIHDENLDVPDERQRLIVALVQKKVSEILNDPQFGASFQIGMLASFESFYKTAKVRKDDEESGYFDDADQTRDERQKEGIDTPAINQINDSYRREFRESLPHPKMDAVVESLAPSFETGDKALVFVRRVKSVDEIAEKLCRKYDDWLRSELTEHLPESIHPELNQVWGVYQQERLEKRQKKHEEARRRDTEGEEGLHIEEADWDDVGGNDNFFSWFFRGDGPKDWLSGTAFRKNRLMGSGSAYSTFFEDNYVTSLLGNPEHPYQALAAELGLSTDKLGEKLRRLAFASYRRKTQQKKFPRLPVYLDYQAAGLVLLSRSRSPSARDARTIQRLQFPECAQEPGPDPPSPFPEPQELVDTETFFTELRRHASLRRELWPESGETKFTDQFREQERRRELLAAVARLGHGFIYLWLLVVNRIGSMRLRAQERTGERAEGLIADYFELLERQRTETTFNAYHELAAVGRHHDLILQVNFPEVAHTPLANLSRLFGQVLSRQNPVGGMYGGVNSLLVRQFRMPGYPIILITTEVLQEGEDLHTFCSKVVHYGITWTPSAMEQRTGRVDRIKSLTHRRLDGRGDSPNPDELLQVYYPYLGDTVERLQVERVFERLNRFIRMIHKTKDDELEDSRIDTRQEFLRLRRDIQQITEPLESSFPVLDEDLKGEQLDIGKPDAEYQRMKEHLQKLREQLSRRVKVEWDELDEEDILAGTAFVGGQSLLVSDDPRRSGEEDVRRQSFILYLRPSGVSLKTVLHCTSPVGPIPDDVYSTYLMDLQSELTGAKLCSVPTKEAENYALSAEGDILFSPEVTQLEEVLDLLNRVVLAADEAEADLFEGKDESAETFKDDLQKEAHHAAD